MHDGGRTLVFILNWKAKNVARAEACAVVHAAVEKRVRIGVWDVQDLSGGRHMTRDALVGGDADFVSLWAQEEEGKKLVTVVAT